MPKYIAAYALQSRSISLDSFEGNREGSDAKWIFKYFTVAHWLLLFFLSQAYYLFMDFNA